MLFKAGRVDSGLYEALVSNRLTHLDVFPFSFDVSNSEPPHLPKAESQDRCGDSEYLFA